MLLSTPLQGLTYLYIYIVCRELLFGSLRIKINRHRHYNEIYEIIGHHSVQSIDIPDRMSLKINNHIRQIVAGRDKIPLYGTQIFMICRWRSIWDRSIGQIISTSIFIFPAPGAITEKSETRVVSMILSYSFIFYLYIYISYIPRHPKIFALYELFQKTIPKLLRKSFTFLQVPPKIARLEKRSIKANGVSDLAQVANFGKYIKLLILGKYIYIHTTSG